MATILLALPSCKSLDPAQLSYTSSASDRSSVCEIRTLNSQLSTVHDSIVYRERIVHDTVYITKEVYRDALNSKFKIQNSTKTDTIVVTEWREKVINHPPERYIPPFYKRCTTILFILLAAGIAYFVCKIYIKFRL